MSGFYRAILILCISLLVVLPASAQNPPATPQTQTITVRVTGAWDDANELNGTATNSSPTEWVGNGGSATTSYLGLRFTGVAIPPGSTINSADLQFYSSQSQWISIAAEVAGELSGTAQPFNVTLPSLRPFTTARVTHNTNVNWAANTWYTFAVVPTVVQEVINHGTWANGGNLALIIRGTGGTWGRKFLTAFDGSATNAPRLVITFTTGGVVPPTATRTPTLVGAPTATNSPTPTRTPTITPTPTRTNTPIPGGQVWNGHPVVVDANGQLLSWVSSAYPYDQVNKWAWNYIQNTVPNTSAGIKHYLSYCCYYEPAGGNTNWYHNPAGLYASFVDSLVMAYPYTGDSSLITTVKGMLDYQLANGTTPAGWLWGSMPYASAVNGQTVYQGDGTSIRDGANGI